MIDRTETTGQASFEIERIMAYDQNGCTVGWFEPLGSQVTCVTGSAERGWSELPLAGFREAVQVLKRAGAVSLAYTRVNVSSGTHRSCNEQLSKEGSHEP